MGDEPEGPRDGDESTGRTEPFAFSGTGGTNPMAEAGGSVLSGGRVGRLRTLGVEVSGSSVASRDRRAASAMAARARGPRTSSG